MSQTTLPSWIGALGRAMEIGILTLDSRGDLSFSNDAARQLFGCATEDELRARWPPVRRKLRAEGALALRRDRATERREVRTDLAWRRDAVRRRLRLEVHALEEDAAGHLVVVKDRDLVDALETNLRDASKMRALARLFVSVAHDLKAPLNAIFLNLELLRRALETGEAAPAAERDKRSRILATVRSEIERLGRMLGEVLRLPSLPQETHRPFDVARVLKEAVLLLHPMARDQNVTVNLAIAAGPIRVRGHRDRLKQALINLLLNALEAMPEGGRLDVDAAARGGAAEIRIRDTGPGIPREVLDRIWTLHFTTRKSGSGIGLHVARSVVEALGGRIAVESVAGAGACFVITLPLAAGGT
ncbi:MAG: HAMP domain-containing histidine kinase [Planctomycetes bacterium]|nr:HAMP domain-containing histidine kinase [Planctomycetota bacterium]